MYHWGSVRQTEERGQVLTIILIANLFPICKKENKKSEKAHRCQCVIMKNDCSGISMILAWTHRFDFDVIMELLWWKNCTLESVVALVMYFITMRVNIFCRNSKSKVP